jgi:hypothetical protein
MRRLDPAPATAPDLSLCPACATPFLCARDVLARRPDGRLVLDLACPNCGWETFECRPAAALAALERATDGHIAAIAAAADTLAMVTELERIDRFALALQEGHVLPEDF